MMEFLVAMFPVMVVFLAVVQFSFAAVAKLVVRHSAALGVRAAVVVLEEYDGQPGTPSNIYNGLGAGVLDEQMMNGEASANQGSSLRDAAKAARGTGEMVDNEMMDKLKGIYDNFSADDSRINQIRKAAIIPFLSISPNIVNEGLEFIAGADPSQQNVEAAVGGSGVDRLAGAFIYNLGAVAVSFPASERSTEYRDKPYEHGEDVTVRVSYLFRCRVPFVSMLICDSGPALFAGSIWSDPAALWEMRQMTSQRPRKFSDVARWNQKLNSLRERIEVRRKRVEAFHNRRADFEQVESSTIQHLLLFQPGARYIPLQAEATLPLQSAQYYPRGI